MAENRATRYGRVAGIAERRVGEGVYLAETNGQAVFRLNETGAALWHLLAESISIEEAFALFHQAFPDHDSGALMAELTSLFRNMRECGLIVEAG